MLEQLSDLVRQYGNDAVVNNNSVPNELNEGVMDEASTSIFQDFRKLFLMVAQTRLVNCFKAIMPVQHQILL